MSISKHKDTEMNDRIVYSVFHLCLGPISLTCKNKIKAHHHKQLLKSSLKPEVEVCPQSTVKNVLIATKQTRKLPIYIY